MAKRKDYVFCAETRSLLPRVIATLSRLKKPSRIWRLSRYIYDPAMSLVCELTAISMIRDRRYRRLRAGEVPATSTPSPGDYLDAYRRARAERVLCLTIPTR